VVYRPDTGQANPLPQLPIKGRWLEVLGFTNVQKNEVISGSQQLLPRQKVKGNN